MKKTKVILGLSGGVDSTTAALLLKEQGYEVIALYLDVLGKGRESSNEAENVANHLGIPFIYKDVSQLFQKKVIAYFYNEYISGRTPNPCVMCNKEIKYHILLQAADEFNAFYIATGHYAKVEKKEEDGLFYVKVAENRKKDQSYVLWKLGQNELSRMIFPLGEIESKEEIREILRRDGFKNAEKKDSQEICFIENNNYISFLKTDLGLKSKPGNFIDKNGTILGKHQGMIHYTVGQRKGLGITFGKPVFVTAMDAKTNTVVLGDNSDLFIKNVKTSNCNYSGKIPENGAKLTGKIRYSADFARCEIFKSENHTFTACFELPQRAPTPGQSLVLYEGDYLLGGGIIEKSL